MAMKYRLKVLRGRKWVLGINEYTTYLEAQTRQLELELVGIKSRLVDHIGGEL